MDKQRQAWAAIIEEIKFRIDKGPRGTVTRLAHLLETTRGTISRWVSGALKGERVSYDKMLFIMDRLGLDPGVYFGPEGRPGGFHAGLGGVPLVGMAACGYDWCTRERLNLTAPRPGEYADNPDVFAVQAIGDSMLLAGIKPGFIVYCNPHSTLEVDDVVYVERRDGTATLKLYRGVDGIWTILEGWTPLDGSGRQELYTIPIRTSEIIRIVPVSHVKRKI